MVVCNRKYLRFVHSLQLIILLILSCQYIFAILKCSLRVHCSLLNNLEKTVCRFLVHVEFDQSIDRIKFEYIVSNIKFIL